MAYVRFLDQVPIGVYQQPYSTGNATLPRVLYAGQTLTIQENQQLVGYDFYNFGTVKINGGSQIPGTDIFTHGLLQIEYLLVNDGTITNNGYLIVGDEFL